MASALHSRQVLLVRCLAKLFDFAQQKGWELTLGEGMVKSPRKMRTLDRNLSYSDGEHMPESLHYVGLAQDLNLFVGEEYIKNSDHPAWVELGKFWENLDPICAWGGNFRHPDGNHFSIRWQGRA
jgi:hypothetical protein